MLKKTSFFSAVVAAIMIVAATAFSDTTINGYTFDDDSDILTNQWRPIAAGETLRFWDVTTQEYIYSTTIDTQVVYGVECLRVKYYNEPETEVYYFWLAEDTLGNIHYFKKMEGGVTFEVNSDDDIPNFYMIANPSLSDSWSWTFDGHQTETIGVESTSATVVSHGGTTYSNCMVLKGVGSGSGDITYEYIAPGQGTVKMIIAQGNIWLRSDISQPSNPPEKPVLFSPTDGAIDVSLTPTLRTGNFSDPDSGDVHLQTQWQVSTVDNFSSTILDTTSISQLTSLAVPQFVLAEGITYFWRARFYDNHSNVSEWSDPSQFTTLTTSNDQNGNGIPDSQENDTVDLDDDGTPDIEQDDIKSLNTVVGDGQMGVSRKDDPTVSAIESIESIDPETISNLARPYSMQLGLFAMRLTVANLGDTAQVTVYFSQQAPAGARWYMYDSIDGWVDYSDHATFDADRKFVILELKDGGYGDADDLANGTIVDPGGFGLASWIEGLVHDASTNQGIGRAEVSISDLALSADPDGHYLTMILPGTYTVEVCATGYEPATHEAIIIPQGEICTEDVGLRSTPGDMVTSDLWIRAVINTEEKGPIDAVWQKGGEDTTTAGDRVIWGHFYAGPADVTWGSANNPDLFAKIWFDHSGRLDVNFFHVSVPEIEVYSDYPYDGTPDEHGTTTMERRYIRQYYDGGQSYSDESYEDGVAAEGYSQTGNPSGYGTMNNLRIGSMINTVERGPIDAVWRLGGQDTTARGDEVVWGHFYASPSDVTWGSQDNPDLFVKIWFDESGRVDVNFFHVSVPDIEVYSDLPTDAMYDQRGTTIMADRYIRHEYWR